MPNVNIPETEKDKNCYGLIGRREEDNISRKLLDMVVQGKGRKGGLDGDGSTPGKICTIYMIADMTENRQYWKMMAMTGQQRCGDGL